jgi:hypothetical protein
MSNNEFESRFAGFTTQALVEAVNRQVGNPGWTSTRARHDLALRQELLRRNVDCTSFITEDSICFRVPVRLDGDRIVQDPTIGPRSDR